MPGTHDLAIQAISLIEKHCESCHNSKLASGDLQLTSLDAALEGGESGPALVPGDARSSLMYSLVKSGTMPLMEPLPPAKKALLRRWIDRGAFWPDPNTPAMPADAIHDRIGAPSQDPILPIAPEGIVDFEKDVFPIFEQRCHSCHGPNQQKAMLRLDNRKIVFQGGKSGPAVLAGKSSESLLLKKIMGIERPQMPPTGEHLTGREIGLIKAWIDQGAIWPENVGVDAGVKTHWAFTRPLQPSIPEIARGRWSANPIDRFIRKKQLTVGLSPVERATPRALVRRLHYGLIGLPPTIETVDAFQEYSRDDWEKMVDGLLQSPRYGERWARHWLDVARYSESIGFEFDRFYPWAFQYRDFVIQAFNSNMPYNTFLQLQIAGDEYAPNDPVALAATGFGAVGPFQANGPTEVDHFDAVDDILGATTQAMLGLTVSCARCHDHKYDPISQKEYYQMLAFLKGTERVNHRLATERAARSNLAKARSRRDRWIKLKTEEWRRQRLVDNDVLVSSHTPLLSVLGESESIRLAPANVSASHFVNDATGRSYGPAIRSTLFDREPIENSLNENRSSSGVFVWATHASDKEWVQYDFLEPKEINYSRVYWLDDELNAGITRLPEQYSLVYSSGGKWNPIKLLESSYTTTKDQFNEIHFEPIKTRSIRLQVQIRPGSSAGIHEWTVGRFSSRARDFLQIANTLQLEGSGHLKKQLQDFLSQNELEHWQTLNSAVRALESQQKFAFGLKDAGFESPQTFLLGRGSPSQRLKEVAPLFPSILVRPGISSRKWFELNPSLEAGTSYRRRAFSRWLTDAKDGAGLLAARVLVNRVWKHHMSSPLVTSVDNFGQAGESPTHPDLLDWLAHDFINNGWNLHRLHRMILLSEAYQLSSILSSDQVSIDPENRWYWRHQPKRIEAEILRDSILSISGKLNTQMFGPSIRPRIHSDALAHATNPRVAKWPKNIKDNEQTWRRSIYIRQRRSLIMPFLEVFDGPDGHISIGNRESTIIPTQSLYLLNSEFVREHSLYLAKKAYKNTGGNLDETVSFIFKTAIGRPPTYQEKKEALTFLVEQTDSYSEREEKSLSVLHAIQDLAQAMISQDEFIYIE